MRADKRRATFGVTYWRRQHPDATDMQAGLYMMRRKWRRIGHAITKAFAEIGLTARAAAQNLADGLAQLARSDLVLSDDPEWYEDANPWDAHTVSFGDTLERIDGTLALHEQTTGCHCRQGPDIVMSVCDQCAFQGGNADATS